MSACCLKGRLVDRALCKALDLVEHRVESFGEARGTKTDVIGSGKPANPLARVVGREAFFKRHTGWRTQPPSIDPVAVQQITHTGGCKPCGSTKTLARDSSNAGEVGPDVFLKETESAFVRIDPV